MIKATKGNKKHTEFRNQVVIPVIASWILFIGFIVYTTVYAGEPSNLFALVTETETELDALVPMETEEEVVEETETEEIIYTNLSDDGTAGIVTHLGTCLSATNDLTDEQIEEVMATLEQEEEEVEEEPAEDVFIETRWEEKFVPDYCGSVHPYMGWQNVTNRTTLQWKLRCEVEGYDENGFGKVKDRYAVAVKPYYGAIGDFLNVTQTDGTTYKCIIVDFKGNENLYKDGWLATYAHGNNDIIEFVVDKYSFTSTMTIYDYHPEWNCNIYSIVNVGNIWEQPETTEE